VAFVLPLWTMNEDQIKYTYTIVTPLSYNFNP